MRCGLWYSPPTSQCAPTASTLTVICRPVSNFIQFTTDNMISPVDDSSGAVYHHHVVRSSCIVREAGGAWAIPVQLGANRGKTFHRKLWLPSVTSRCRRSSLTRGKTHFLSMQTMSIPEKPRSLERVQSRNNDSVSVCNGRKMKNVNVCGFVSDTSF